MGLVYYIMDTETNGLSVKTNEIIELSVIRCSDRHQFTKKIICEHPENSQQRALEITKRSYASLSEGEPKEKVVKEVEDFFAQDGMTPEYRCIVAYQASFDMRFLHALWEKVGKEFPAHNWMCALKFAREWVKTIGKTPKDFKLHSVLAFAGIKPMPGIHAADCDSRNTYLFWKKGMDKGINHLPCLNRKPHVKTS